MRNYRVTGPVEMTAGPMISHRSAEFGARLADVVAGLGKLFGTRGLVLPLTCSGTGGLEAAVASVLRRGDRVLSVQQGYFGERFAEIAAFHGAQVDTLAFPWGTAPTAVEIGAKLAAGYDAVLLTHNETSTGVLAPLSALATAIRSASVGLVLVDVVSSLGATQIDFDDLGLDVAVGVTQKALACPPGMALVAVSDRALTRAASPGAGSYYLNLAAAADHIRSGTTTYTPALTVVFALEAALAEIEKEGMEDVWARHANTARRCREALRAHGLSTVVDEPLCSPTVTPVQLPGPHAERLRDELADRYDTWVSSGRAAWKRDVVRIGHMGHVSAADIDSCVEALASVSATLSGRCSTKFEVPALQDAADDLEPE
jgi:aspartate aminotransferase-like enzyme